MADDDGRRDRVRDRATAEWLVARHMVRQVARLGLEQQVGDSDWYEPALAMLRRDAEPAGRREAAR